MTNILYQKALERWGSRKQSDQLIEEMAELTKAIIKSRRKHDTPECIMTPEIIEELADVEIMLEQMKLIAGEEVVQIYKLQKLEKLRAYLND